MNLKKCRSCVGYRGALPTHSAELAILLMEIKRKVSICSYYNRRAVGLLLLISVLRLFFLYFILFFRAIKLM